MAKKGKRKSKTTKKVEPMQSEQSKLPEELSPEPYIKAIEKTLPQPPINMVNLRAKIHDIGMFTITVPVNKVDEVLEKIWRTGFKQKLANYQRTHQVYGPHMIDRIDVEPVI